MLHSTRTQLRSGIHPLAAVLAFSGILFALQPSFAQAQDRTMMQGFYWDATPGGVWYDSLAYYADVFARAGFNSIWFPPPSKGAAGPFDVGYSPYDYYDLGEFDSAPGDFTSGLGNFIPTRYGTRAGLQAAIRRYHENGMQVYADVVLNHRSGGSLERNPFAQYYTSRTGGSLFSPDGDSTYTAFPLRHGSGRIAWPAGQGAPFFFPNGVRNPGNTGDFFSDNQIGGFHQLYLNSFGYDNALHNGDGSNLPMGDSLIVWGQWLLDEIGFDGFRFDFVKGVHPEYFKRFMNTGSMRGRFHVHELYDGDINRLKTYLNQISGTQQEGTVFDFNLRFTYKEMSDGGNNFDIRTLHNRGLFNNGVPYDRIVTFVENHDFDRTNFLGQATQEGHSPITNNKILAYAHMLTHPGYAQVWWRDYFHYGMRDQINRLVQIRSQFASGMHRIPTAYTDGGGDFQAPFWPGNASEDPKHVYVGERVGTGGQTGLLVAINKHNAFNIDVWVTVKAWAGRQLYDITGNIPGTTEVFADGRVLLRTQPSSYAVFVPTDYVLSEDINLEMTAVDSPSGSYLVGDEITPRVRITSMSTFSQNSVPVIFEFFKDDALMAADTVTVARINAGDQIPVVFKPFVFSEIGQYEAVARLDYMLDQDASDDSIRFTIMVADTLGAWPYRIDGVASESQYRTMAVKQNANAGFGLGKDVRALRFADTPDTLYVFVEGRVPLNDGDGIALFLDFSEVDGAAAGTALGNVPGGAFFHNTGNPLEGGYKMDFEVDYSFALFGVQSTRAALNVARYTGLSAEGAFVVAPGGSPSGDGTAAQGPADSDVFPEGSIRYAFSRTGDNRHGLELAIARSALADVSGGQVRGFAAILSSTAYFSNVLVPGDALGDADAFENFGFNVDFAEIEGGPFHSAWLAVNSTEAEPVPGIVELGLPTDMETEVDFRPAFTWNPADRAARYSIQLATQTLAKRNHLAENWDSESEPVFFVENLSDTTYTHSTNLRPSTAYMWRVRAENSSGVGPWSATRYFTTADVDPAPTVAPTLTFPISGARDVQQPIALTWTSVENATQYEVQMSRTQTFLSFAVRTFTDQVILNVADLTDNVRFFWRVRGVSSGGVGPWSSTFNFVTELPVSIDTDTPELPTELGLAQNHPNPFNPTTVIQYAIPQQNAGSSASVRISVYDILGREIAVLVDQPMAPGRYTVTFDAAGVSSGIYLYRLQYGNSVMTRKMTIMK
jgi:alpha-amylase